MLKNTNIFLVFAFGFLSLLALATPVHAQSTGLTYQLLEKIPGTAGLTNGTDLAGYVQALYRVALIVVTLSAVFMITVGGFMYLTSAGNTAAMSNAKGVIFDALIGLIIALVAWLVLYVINPDLVKTAIPALAPVTVVPPTGGGGGAGGGGPLVSPGDCATPNPSRACCPAGLKCQACEGCSPVDVTHKTCGLGTCYLNTALLNKIRSINGVSGWQITESWPPTVNHISTCHQSGQCADLNNSGGATDTATIKTYYDAFKAAGLNVLYESKNCAPYIAAGVDNCGVYNSMTNGSSFHVTN